MQLTDNTNLTTTYPNPDTFHRTTIKNFVMKFILRKKNGKCNIKQWSNDATAWFWHLHASGWFGV